MHASLSWLKEYIDIDISVKDLADKLTNSGFEVEEIKEEDEDTVLQIKVSSNRGDCLSIMGMAREASAILGKNLKLSNVNIKETTDKLPLLNIVEIKEPTLCLRYCGKIIKNIKVGPGPLWMQKRLISCGVRPINNIVDITNYVCLELGQPLHAFDYHTLSGKKIIVRCAEPTEKILTLDEKERILSSDTLVIADEKRAVAVAGVIGGKETEITDRTKEIFLESAHFKPESIRKTSKELGLSTSSSYRFERWVDPSTTNLALNRAADLILNYAGGEVIKEEIDIYPQRHAEREILFSPERCYSILGWEVGKEKIKNIFERLQFKVEEKEDILRITIPTFRKDILQEEDLIEEVCRIYGYNNIPTTMPVSSLSLGKQIYGDEEGEIRDFLVGNGFSEVITHSLVKEVPCEFTILFDAKSENIVHLKNPRIPDVTVMRAGLLPSLLDVVRYNFSQQNHNISIFEMGKIYLKQKTHREIKALSFLISGQIGKNIWTEKKIGLIFDYFYLKGIVEKFLEKLGIFNFYLAEEKQECFYSSVCAGVKIRDKKVGIFGEISPNLLKKLDITQKVYGGEFNVSEILKFIPAKLHYNPLSRFPYVSRDIALIIDKDIPYEKVINTIKETNIDILEKVDLFDEYIGPQIPAGKKNLALSFIYRSQKSTLSSSEVNSVQEEILKKLKDKYDARIR